jgi:hypothetical protein
MYSHSHTCYSFALLLRAVYPPLQARKRTTFELAETQQRLAAAETARDAAVAERNTAAAAMAAAKQQASEAQAAVSRAAAEIAAVKGAATAQAQDVKQQLASKDR